MARKKIRVRDTCICCDREGVLVGRGLIVACHRRHSDAGTLKDYPTTHQLIRKAYLPLFQRGVGVREAARRIEVNERTISRHKKALRQLAGATS